MNLFFTDKT